MKKLISLGLVFVLMLTAFSGCSFFIEPNKQTPEEPSASGLHFELESLPDIGEFSLNKKAEYFFSDGAQSVFEPRDDYGAVVPYFADVSFYSEITGDDYYDGWQDYEPFSSYEAFYGLMSGDGKIITGSLWSEYTFLRYDENSGIFFLTRATRDGGESADIIPADGSWKIEGDMMSGMHPLFSFGLPMFMLGHGSECKIYSLDGKSVLDISEYMKKEVYGEPGEEEIYYYTPDIVYADDEIFLIKTAINGQEDYDSARYIALTRSGEEKYSFILENAALYHLGGGLLSCYDYITNEIFLVNPKGERLYDGGFDMLNFSYADKTVLGIKEGVGELYLSWINEKAELTDEKILQEDNEAYDLFKYNFYQGANGAVILDYWSDLCYSFYGEPIEFPVPKDEISRINTVYAPTMYSSDDYLAYEYFSEFTVEAQKLYLAVYTVDGRCILCNINGEPICETEQSKKIKSSENGIDFYDIDIDVSGNYVCCIIDNERLLLYSLENEKCTEADISELVNSYDTVYIQIFNENIAVLYCYSDGYDRNNSIMVRLEDGSLLYNSIIFYSRFGEFYLVASKTYTAVLNSTGKEIIRLPIGSLA